MDFNKIYLKNKKFSLSIYKMAYICVGTKDYKVYKRKDGTHYYVKGGKRRTIGKLQKKNVHAGAKHKTHKVKRKRRSRKRSRKRRSRRRK